MSPPPPEPSLRELCHQLSQPLTAARCSLELVLQLPPEDPAREGFLQDAVTALDRMAEMTRALRAAAEPPRPRARAETGLV